MVMIAASLALALIACDFEPDIRDCSVVCSAATGCPDGLSCSPSEGWCRTPESNAACPGARPCTGGDINMSTGGTCLMLFTTPGSWSDANGACIALGTHLAILDTATKHGAAKALAAGNDAWIGLSDVATEMAFRWVDVNVLLAYTAWAPMEPNNGGGVAEEDCVVIAGARGGEWDDRPCSPAIQAGAGSYGYLCQF